jgi:hypothetical protein
MTRFDTTGHSTACDADILQLIIIQPMQFSAQILDFAPLPKSTPGLARD